MKEAQQRQPEDDAQPQAPAGADEGDQDGGVHVGKAVDQGNLADGAQGQEHGAAAEAPAVIKGQEHEGMADEKLFGARPYAEQVAEQQPQAQFHLAD